jgi:hypothetical protein
VLDDEVQVGYFLEIVFDALLPSSVRYSMTAFQRLSACSVTMLVISALLECYVEDHARRSVATFARRGVAGTARIGSFASAPLSAGRGHKHLFDGGLERPCRGVLA